MTIKTALALLLALAGSTVAHADAAPDRQAALHFLDTYYAALKHHDAAALDAMIAGDAPVVVFFADDGSEQKFTLSKAEYLQQIRAVWHFATDEAYTEKNIDYHPAASPGAPAVVSLDDSESRTILGNPSGQHNQLEISLACVQGSVRIVAIKTHTTIW